MAAISAQRRLFIEHERAARQRACGRLVAASELGDAAGQLAAEACGDRWLLAGGDSYDLLSQLPAESLDLVITSPPYWGHRSYGQDHNWEICKLWRGLGHGDEESPPYEWYRQQGGILGLEPTPDWFIHHLVEIFERAKGALKAQGSLWVNLGDTYFARWSSIRDNGRQGLGDDRRERRRTPMGGYRQEKQLLLIPARFAIAMQQQRWILRNDLIWHKPNVPPRPEKDRLRLAHEHFFHFVKRPTEGRASYYYDLAAVEQAQNDVVTYPVRPGEPGHSATFPEDLVWPRISSSCPPGGLVLDPFCGTGRAVIAAVASGRKAIGFDVVEEFLAMAETLLAAQRTVDG
jgi:site-specific DNA-methyltransferase (cytosine-N4-specific)